MIQATLHKEKDIEIYILNACLESVLYFDIQISMLSLILIIPVFCRSSEDSNSFFTSTVLRFVWLWRDEKPLVSLSSVVFTLEGLCLSHLLKAMCLINMSPRRGNLVRACVRPSVTFLKLDLQSIGSSPDLQR